jgi:DNA-binding NarL/FixJ family response regulator
MDIRMPVLGGIEATRQLTRAAVRPKVLVLTTFDLDDYVYDALRAGASGFLLKDATPEEILHAVRVIGGGEALLAPAVTRRLIAEFAARSRPVPPPELGRLTPRENEVLLLMAGGLTNAEIAGRLCLAEQTVKSHVSSVLFKLELRDRVQAVILAYESGLVVPGAPDGEETLARKGEAGRA